MDVIAMHHAGIANCVAPLGTSLTERQVRLLKRYVPRVALAFDADAAGEKATLKAVEMLEREEEDIRVVELPGGMDPADVVMRDGPEAMRSRLEGAREFFPFLMEKALSRHDRSTSKGKEEILDFLFPFVAVVGSRVRADDYVRRLADAIGADEASVREDFSRWRRGLRAPAALRPAEGPRKAVSAELFLMLAIAARQELFPLVRKGGIAISDLEDPMARELFVALEESFRAGEASFDGLLERIEDPSLRRILLSKVASGEFDMNQERMVAESVRRIKLRALSRRRDTLPAEIGRLEREKTDPARLNELLAEKMHLDDEFAKLGAKGSHGDGFSDKGQDAGL
jgi:DNA primase